MPDTPPLLELAVRHRLGDFALDAHLLSARGPLVIIGPSGAGKSATLRAIAGVLRPECGRIAINGRLLLDTESGVDVPPQLRRVGYVPQDYAPLPASFGRGQHRVRSAVCSAAARAQPRRRDGRA